MKSRHLDGLAAAIPRIVAGMLAIAAMLAAVMAVLAPINQRPDLWRGPPDELGHGTAARYYLDHWLPPRVGDPTTLESYSLDYGFSYINDPDLTYPLAGKFAKLISPLVPDAHLGFRLFNVSLLALLAVLCFLRPASWPLFVPLLLSPQVWYVFSYFNGDAFPLFLCVVLALQVVDPASRFNRFLDEPGLRRYWSGALIVAALVAMLLVSKKNYLAFVVLLPAVIALTRFNKASALLLAGTALAGSAWYLHSAAIGDLSMWQKQASPVWALSLATVAILAAILLQPSTRRVRAVALAKLSLLGVIAVAAIGPRYLWDARVHGSLDQKRIAIGALQERVAKPDYKPSTIYARDPKTYYGIGLRGRGVPLEDMFGPEWAWHKRTFFTATGTYGWIQFFSPPWYYHVLPLGYLAIFAIYVFAVVRARSAAAACGFALVAAFSAMTVGIALFHSWNNDFQAQGRYLFPIVPMLGVGLFLVRDTLPRKTLLAALAACFALGLYSFVFTGLRYVPGSF